MQKDQSSSTIEYYNRNYDSFSQDTISANLFDVQNRFLDLLPGGAFILDFGCGSGRDSKYFLDKGYVVTAIDGSEELCKIASDIIGQPVRHMLFQELDEENVYDGIWACASILHLPKEDLRSVFEKMTDALKPEGILYASFKYGTFEGMRNGRYFCDFTEETFAEFFSRMKHLTMLEEWISADVRKGRENEQWLNLLLKKK